MTLGFFIETTERRLWFTTANVDFLPLQISPAETNRDTVMGLIEAWVCLLADSPLNSTKKSEKPPKTFRRWFRYLTSRPIKDTIVELSRLSHKLASLPTLYGSGSYTGDWIQEFSELPIFKEYHTWFKTGDPVLFRYIYNFLTFGKKLPYEDPELNATALHGWHKVEERLHALVLDTMTLRNLKEIMGQLIGPKQLTPFSPKFGPGAVSEKGLRGNIKKANNLHYDAKLDRAFFKSHFVNYGLDEELGFSAEKVIPDPKQWNRARKRSRRYSRLEFVRKDTTKSRSICAEPNSYMSFQQGYCDQLLRRMDAGLASRFINIRDQSTNRNLARYGSETGDIDTIDLSAASDSVSIDLVKGIFPRDVLYFLLATRTSRVSLPDGSIIGVKKFAPMGSALCFPIQCLVFTSIVILAAMLEQSGAPAGTLPGEVLLTGDEIAQFVRSKFRTSLGYVSPDMGTYQPAAVYGDDICVDSRLTQHVIHLLTSLGFEVNTEKSFTASQAFRESCGGYYYGGEEVTPIFYRVDGYVGGLLDYRRAASMVSLANHAGDAGLTHLRRVCIQHLMFDSAIGLRRVNGRNPIRFSNNRDDGMAIYTPNPRNTHLTTRINADWQCEEVQCAIVNVDRNEVPDEEDTLLYTTTSGMDGGRNMQKTSFNLESYLRILWWRNHRGIVHADDSQAYPRTVPSGSRLRVRWTHM